MVEFSAWYYDEIKQLLGAILAQKAGAMCQNQCCRMLKEKLRQLVPQI